MRSKFIKEGALVSGFREKCHPVAWNPSCGSILISPVMGFLVEKHMSLDLAEQSWLMALVMSDGSIHDPDSSLPDFPCR
jgi:hypothetical protein